MRGHRLFRIQVDVRPLVAVGPDGQHGDVERAVPLADLGEGGGVTGVPAEVDAVPRTGDGPRAPQRRVPLQPAAGEVPRFRAGQCQLTHHVLLVPVEFDDAVLRHPPTAQVGTDPERDQERRGLGEQQAAHGRQVEVVVVVVGDDDGVQHRQVRQRQRDRVQPRRSDRQRRRHPLAPHRVGEHVPAIDLDQGSGMSEPGDGQLARHGRGTPGDQRDRPGRAPGTAVPDQRRDHRDCLTGSQDVTRLGVVEGAIGEVW